MKRYYVQFLFLALPFSFLSGQGSGTAYHQMSFTYGFHLSAMDLAERFGAHWSIGLGLEKIRNDKWLYGLEFNLQFGNQVKEDVLAGLRSDRGIIIGINETKADVFLRQRGAYYGMTIGRQWILGSTVSPHRIQWRLGGGLWQHKIRIVDDSNSVPQLHGQFTKGYDRLSNGIATKQVLNYTYKSNKNNLHMFLQFEALGGIIRNRRDWDIASRKKLDRRRLDATFGIRIGWILPLGTGGTEKEDIYY